MSYNESVYSDALCIGDAGISQMLGYIDFEITDQEWFERHKFTQYVSNRSRKKQLIHPRQDTQRQLSSLQQRAPPQVSDEIY